MAACMQCVMVADAKAANQVLGSAEALNKGLEPDLSDKMLSHRPGQPHHVQRRHKLALLAPDQERLRACLSA